MKQLVTQAMVLSRTEFGEADRIVSLLTPDQGKLRLMAKGVRRVKSKLAGGIELFSISDITYLPGKSGIGTLISARLQTHYGKIVTDIDRVQLGYELIKQVNKTTEDATEREYFDLLQHAFAALDNIGIVTSVIRFWFSCQLLQMAGYAPNLMTDTNDEKLQAGERYNFAFDAMSFQPQPKGSVTTNMIKLLRLSFSGQPPGVLAQLQDVDQLLPETSRLVEIMRETYI